MKSTRRSGCSSFLFPRATYPTLTVDLYHRFWQLQEILCNRDYLSKSPEKWPELKTLLTTFLSDLAAFHSAAPAIPAVAVV